jgi:hypothetical protein
MILLDLSILKCNWLISKITTETIIIYNIVSIVTLLFSPFTLGKSLPVISSKFKTTYFIRSKASLNASSIDEAFRGLDIASRHNIPTTFLIDHRIIIL